MNRRLGIFVAASVLGLVSPALITTSAASAATCQPGLAGGLTWDHSDPAFMKVVTTSAWKNCNKQIRKVVQEYRVLNANGGLDRTEVQTWIPDVVHKPNGKEQKQIAYYPGFFGSTLFWDPDHENSMEDHYMTCTQHTNGEAATGLTSRTYYMVIRAYNKSGKKILEKITPTVACDQNG